MTPKETPPLPATPATTEELLQSRSFMVPIPDIPSGTMRVVPIVTARDAVRQAADAERIAAAARVDGLATFAAHLRDMLTEASLGPFQWGPTADTAADFLAACDRQTAEHGDAQERSWVVQSTDTADPVTVAFSGNGPRAHHNAELIAFLLNNAPALAALAEAPARPPVLDVERLGLSDEQTAILRDLLASRQQTVSQWLGDALMDWGLGRATGKEYPPATRLAEPRIPEEPRSGPSEAPPDCMSLEGHDEWVSGHRACGCDA